MNKKFRMISLILCIALSLACVLSSCKTDDTKVYYTLIFATNGGSNNKDFKLEEGDAIPSITTEKDFHVFSRWVYDNGSGAMVTFDLTTMPAKNLTVYAEWLPEEYYSITYVSNGGSSVESDVFKIGDRPARPQNPTKENYVFSEWYLTENLISGTEYQFNNQPQSSFTLYAKWVLAQNAAEVIFYGNGVEVYRRAVLKGTRIIEPSIFDSDVEHVSWFTSFDAGVLSNPFSFSTPITEELRLYTSYGTLGINNSGNNSISVVSSYTGNSERVVIRYGTTAINANVFRNNLKIKEVIIPDSVVSIGVGAFAGCKNLTSVTMSNSVRDLPDELFLDASSLKSINWHNTIETIGEGAFYGTSLETLNLSFLQNLKYIDDNAFANCSSLREVEFPSINAFNRIGNRAFYNCTSINTISIPANVLTIGENAFSRCTGLQSFSVDRDNPNYYATSDASDADRYNLFNNGKTQLIMYVKGDKTESTYQIPANSTVGTIKSNSFYGAVNLKELTISKQISFERGALEGLNSLEKLTLFSLGSQQERSMAFLFGMKTGQAFASGVSFTPSTLRAVRLINQSVLNSYAFYGCTSLKEISTDATGGFSTISDYAFAYTAIESFSIGAALNSFGDNVFEGCEQLTQIENTGSNPKFQSVENGFYFTSGALKRLIRVFGNPERFVVPSNVTNIDSYAFYNCLNLKEMTIPFIGADEAGTEGTNYFSYIFGSSDPALSQYYVPRLEKLTISKSLTKIPESAFQNSCIELFDLRASKNTLEAYGDGAFYQNTALFSDVSMKGFVNDDGSIIPYYNPSKLKSIGAQAFYSCGLKGLNVAFFDGVTRGGTIEITSNITSLGEGAFAFNDFENIKVSASLRNIERGAFFNNPRILGKKDGENARKTMIELPSSLKEIRTEAFSVLSGYEKQSLEGDLEVVFKEGVALTLIGESAFNSSGLRKITVPKTTVTIDSGAFMFCPMDEFSLESGSVLETLGTLAFSQTYLIKNLELPSTLKQIGVDCFASGYQGIVSNLEELIVGDSIHGSKLANIRMLAFAECYNLKSITIHRNTDQGIPELEIVQMLPNLDLAGPFHFSGSELEIRVPEALLDAFKAHEDWSIYADILVKI